MIHVGFGKIQKKRRLHDRHLDHPQPIVETDPARHGKAFDFGDAARLKTYVAVPFAEVGPFAFHGLDGRFTAGRLK